MKQLIILLISIILALKIGYDYGQRELKSEIAEKKVEEIRNVSKKKAKIHSKPNANRHELLKLMFRGQL